METYSLAQDFGGNINSERILNTVNDNATITPNLGGVGIIGDMVHMYFDSILTGTEKSELDNLVANHDSSPTPETVTVDDISYVDYASHYTTYMISGMTFSGNTPSDLTNWTHISGSLPGFNPVTGVMTFQNEGIYCFGLTAMVQTSGNNNSIAINIYDNLDQDRFIQTQQLNNLAQGAPGGGCTFSAPNYMAAGETLTTEVEFKQNETCDFVLRVIKIL